MKQQIQRVKMTASIINLYIYIYLIFKLLRTKTEKFLKTAIHKINSINRKKNKIYS